MNKIELIKTEKDGLKIKSDIHRFAKEGWESISEEDIQRLKWYGLFLRNPTPRIFYVAGEDSQRIVVFPSGKGSFIYCRNLWKWKDRYHHPPVGAIAAFGN